MKHTSNYFDHQKSLSSQDINESVNFRFFQRLLSYLVSAETVRDLLLSAETTVHEKRLPAETVRAITWTVSAGSYLSSTTVSIGSKRSRTVSAEAKYDGQSQHVTKISGLVYTLSSCLNHWARNMYLFFIHNFFLHSAIFIFFSFLTRFSEGKLKLLE